MANGKKCFYDTVNVGVNRRKPVAGAWEYVTETTAYKAELEIDVDSIMKTLAVKAAGSKSKRSRYMSGDIVCRVKAV